MSDLTSDVAVTRICGQRDLALSKIAEAISLMEQGHALALSARETAVRAADGSTFSLLDRSQDAAFRRLLQGLDGEASAEVFRKHTDACIWQYLIKATGMEELMDAHARNEFFKQLQTDVPEVNEENIIATLEALHGDAGLIFARGLARTFADLDKRFKSHDAFRLGSRIIITRCFNEYGSWDYYAEKARTIADVERVLAKLDGKAPQPGELKTAIDESRAGHYGPRQGVVETRYLKIRTFMNGNAHLWFTRPDLTKKANLVLADYYGEVLPDAVPKESDNLGPKPGLPAKDLAFYSTPDAVVGRLLGNLHLPKGARVLEPSAGTGDIVRPLMALGYRVDAIEIDPGRVSALRHHRGLTVYAGNFLQMPARSEYDAVVMNPPFSGVHWIQHVVHAFDWLAPNGVLLAILPVTAEIGDSAKHKAFRKWAKERYAGHGSLYFTSLPPESFASSGTRINTVILELHKPRA